MKVLLTCKLFDNDAYYYVKPLSDLDKIEQIWVYRDNQGIANPKIQYITTKLNRSPLRFIWRFFQMLGNIKQSDILIGVYEIPHGLLALLVGMLRNKPVIISVIGNPKLNRRTKGIRGKITNIILKRCDVITVTGTVGQKYYIHERDYDPEKIFVLPNSIDTEEYKSIKVKNEYDIITLGRLSTEKGLQFFIDIIASLKLRFPNIRVGTAGRGIIQDQLQNRIDFLSLSDNITLLGYVKDPIRFLNSGKVFLTTSTTEGLPRTIIQSLACGTPVVSSNVGDISDLIIDGKTGRLIDYYCVATFTDALSTLLKSPQKLFEMAELGKQHVKIKYDHIASKNVWNNILHYLNYN